MAIAVRGSPVEASNVSATSLALNFGGQGMATGDLVIAFGSLDDSTSFDSQWAAETNWHMRRSWISECSPAMYWRLADAGFVASPSVTFDRTGSADQMGLVGIILSGVHQTIPVSAMEMYHDLWAGADPFLSVSSLYAPADGCWIVAAIAQQDIGASGWAPAGYTERIIEDTNANAQVALATKALSGTPPIVEVPGTWNVTSGLPGTTMFMVVVPDTASFTGGGGIAGRLISGGLLG